MTVKPDRACWWMAVVLVASCLLPNVRVLGLEIVSDGKPMATIVASLRLRPSSRG